MSTPAPVSVVDDDIGAYPLHEEDDVPEGSLHQRWCNYLYNVLSALFREWFVSGNVCVYWEPGNYQAYVAPDVFIAQGHVPEPPPRVYRSWLLPPLIFVAEIGSQATADRGAKLELYAAHLRPAECLYTEPVNEEAGETLTPERVHLYRLAGEAYVPVEPQPNGRLRSTLLQLEIGVDGAGNLRLYTPDGEPMRTYEEAEDERRAEAAARTLAERERVNEAEARVEAERRALEAERRAAEERSQREALERQVAELQARLKLDGS